jgi:hypothetical protein
MKTVLSLLIIVLITGCAHQLELISRDNSGNGTGVAQEANQSISISVNGVNFKGTYVYDGGTVVNSYNYSTATAYNRTGTTQAYGNSYGTSYVPGSGNGRIVASSGTNTIHCDFMFQQMSGIGYCQDNNGKQYDLIIH